MACAENLGNGWQSQILEFKRVLSMPFKPEVSVRKAWCGVYKISMLLNLLIRFQV